MDIRITHPKAKPGRNYDVTLAISRSENDGAERVVIHLGTVDQFGIGHGMARMSMTLDEARELASRLSREAE